MNQNEQFSNQRLAHSASAIGAAILGFGLGAQWGAGFVSFAWIAIISGTLIHGAGMFIVQYMNRYEQNNWMAKALWISAWICLAALVVFMILILM